MNTTNSFVPPGGPLEVVFSFDTTGSMYDWLDELRGSVQDLIERLQADIPGIKIAVFAHGDYCDVDIYVTKWIDLTSNIVKLCEFVKTVEITNGGDLPECYELVLRQVRTELSWTPGSRRVLIMIGDENPHKPTDDCNTDHIDWKQEVKMLAQNGVTIYGVQCCNNWTVRADTFYRTISLATGGKHLRLEDLGSLFDTLMAVCYREGNNMDMLANYEKEVRARSAGIGSDIDTIFANLRSDAIDTSTPSLVKHTSSISAAKHITLPKLSDVKRSLHGTAKTNICRISSNIKKTKTVKSNLNKFKNSNLPLLKRENVPESNFLLRSLRWCPWKLAIVNDKDLPKEKSEMWEKRSARPGYSLKMLSRPKSLFTQHNRKSTLFEVAVQARGTHKKRYVVFSAISNLSFVVGNWEQRLLGVARSQVDNILSTGGRVFVRFCFIENKSILESSKTNLRRYDYAWRSVKALRACSRHVVKGNVVISKSGS
uniref:VWFA domain-containing protein n=1 Tax=Arion vulgaris TaxID=1028688 RepID=A0A0B7A309_9EUPU